MAKPPVEPVTPEEVITKLRDAYNEAMDNAQYGAAARTAELLGKYIGLFGSTSPTTNPLSSENLSDPRIEKLSKLTKSVN